MSATVSFFGRRRGSWRWNGGDCEEGCDGGWNVRGLARVSWRCDVPDDKSVCGHSKEQRMESKEVEIRRT